MCRKNTFTLIELIISVTLFAMIFISAGGTFYALINNWARQRNAVMVIQDIRWAVKFIGQEVRAGTSAGGPMQAKSNNNPINHLKIGIDSDNNGSRDTMVWYWRGDQADDATQYGSRDFIYRGTGADLAAAYTNRVMLCDFVVANPSGNDIFDMSPGNRELIMEITMRPTPGTAEGYLNRNFTIITTVKAKD
jgi:type II secretory pathway pseudopilin PulG